MHIENGEVFLWESLLNLVKDRESVAFEHSPALFLTLEIGLMETSLDGYGQEYGLNK